MSYQNVDVYLKERQTGAPVEGVLVRVLSEDGNVIYTEASTDSQGRASFLLLVRAYSLRFYKFQTAIQQPQVISLAEGAPGVVVQNQYNVYAESVVPPVASDVRLCRASGFFRDITGAPHRNLDIFFVGEFAPVLLDGAGVLSERRAIRTDARGYACTDLIRCAIYSATVEGYEDSIRTIKVPDAPSVSLPALLFPTVESVYFDLPSPWSLSVGSEFTLHPTVVTSSKVTTEGADQQNVLWSVEDPTVAEIVSFQENSIVLQGLSSGTTKLLARRSDLSVMTIPFVPELIGSGQSIVVT